jgi:LmbE family N-acetylglucosaminyl deacetylase
MLSGGFRARHTPLDLRGKRVLVISPHQDDETLGCGGFLLNCRGQAEVQVICMTSGKGPERLRSEEQRGKLAGVRQQEERNVCEALGLRSPINFEFDGPDLKDNDLVVQRLSTEIERFRPDIIVAPFFTDAHWQHLWTTKSLAKVPPDTCNDCKVMLYRAHAHIPTRFQNAYFGLTPSIHEEKEKVLSLFETQKLNVGLTRAKYLLYSTVVPRSLRKRFKSVERFCVLKFIDFATLEQEYGTDDYLYRFRSMNNTPYSFRCYAMNILASKLSPFCRKGPKLLDLSVQI